MSLPLSDAETTFMPELHPATSTYAVAEARSKCAWCDISLAAIPESPRPVFAPNGRVVYTHPGGCTSAFRQVVGWTEPVSSEHRGTSDPR